MKRIIIFLILTLKVFAQEHDLEFFIAKYLANSLDVKIQEKNTEKELLKESELKLGKYSKLSLNLDDNYSDEKYLSSTTDSHSLDTSLSYGIFSHNMSYDHKTEKITSNSVTVEKELNELINNEYKYNYEAVKLQNLIAEKRRKLEKIEKIKEIVAKYVDAKKMEKELELKENFYKLLVEEKKQLDLKYKNGEIKRIDVELLNLDINTNTREQENLRNKIKNAKVVLLTYLNLQLDENIDLKDIRISKDIQFDKVGKLDYEIIKLEKELSDKEVKFAEKDELPTISAYSTYSIKEKGYKVGVSVTKDFEFINYDKKSKQLNNEIAELNLQKSKQEIDESVKKLRLDYGVLLNEQKRISEKKIYKEKEIEIYKAIYRENQISYIEFAKKQQEFEEIQLEYIENELDIISFVLSVNATSYIN